MSLSITAPPDTGGSWGDSEFGAVLSTAVALAFTPAGRELEVRVCFAAGFLRATRRARCRPGRSVWPWVALMANEVQVTGSS